MFSKIGKAFWIALCVGVGFYVPDYIKGTFDRADIAVPMIAFFTAFVTLVFWTKEN